MTQKVIRDPLYNYVGLDTADRPWLLEVLNSREVQRLRRIHQLGVSSFTYPGADHSRLCHSLGVPHLMGLALQSLGRQCDEEEFRQAVPALLAAALVHDVGHGPFSHLFEPCLGIDHEEWTMKIVRDPDCEVSRALSRFDTTLPDAVADLVDTENFDRPLWQKALVSSQLDVDRLDYLRRDSLFTGAGYGAFDWSRLIASMRLHGDRPNRMTLVWPEKAKLAVEEYVFARYYMYQNVYLHKTTRGFEVMLKAMWDRAKGLRDDATDVALLPAIEGFWSAADPDCGQYLQIEEFTVLGQIQAWGDHADPALSDLARRFLKRDRFAMIEAPSAGSALNPDLSDWEDALTALVAEHAGFRPTSMYCLKDDQKPKYHLPYIPEREDDEQTVHNSIRLERADGSLVEISRLLGRLKAFTRETGRVVHYYVPRELRAKVKRLRDQYEGARPAGPDGGPA